MGRITFSNERVKNKLLFKKAVTKALKANVWAQVLIITKDDCC